MSITRLLIGALALTLGAGGATARQLTVAQALEAAGLSTTMATPGSASSTFTLSRDGLNTVYVVNSAAGFVILAADDVAPAILGYADNGNFDPNNIPPNMQAWLDDYSAYIATAAENGGRVISAPADPSLTDIAPIVSTRWNQGAPYYNMCPTVNGQRTYTGCVATAIAQVMNTYRHPATGTGTNSYTWNNQTLSLNFSDITFDWDNMADTYGSNSTPAEQNAVAELMYACGIACYMNYGTGGSGANGVNLAVGLINYLGYDASLKYLSRDYFTLPQWCRMLHEQLSTGHPLYYDGANANIGHAFVIDGYRSSDGFFHLNWGWGGMSDGYYSIITLDPDSQGIGGSTEGYYLGQSAIFGLKPAEEGSQIAPVFAAENILPASITVARGEYAELGSYASIFYSISLGTVEAEVGVELTAANAEPIYVFYPEAVEFDYGSGFRQLPVPTQDIPEGTYTGRPVARCNGETVPFLVEVGDVSHFTCTATESTITFSPIDRSPKLELVEMKALSPFFRGRQCYVEVSVKNSGFEYYGDLTLVFVNTKGKESTIGSAVVDLLTDDSATVNISGTIPGLTPTGTCYLRLYDGNHQQIGADMAVELEKAPDGTPAPQIVSAGFTGIAGGLTSSDPAIVDASQIKIEAGLNVGAGYYTSPIRAYVFELATGAYVDYLSTPYVACWGTETQTLNFAGDLSGVLSEGTTYIVAFAHLANNQYNIFDTPNLFFTAGDASGIEEVTATNFGVFPNPATDAVTITAPAAITGADIFDIAGALRASYDGSDESDRLSINISNLATGNYLLRVTTTSGAVKTLRLIKK